MARSFDMGGDRNYAALSPAEQAGIDFVNWVVSNGSTDAAHAARHLRSAEPARFTKAVASWKAGDPRVLPALQAMADAARNR